MKNRISILKRIASFVVALAMLFVIPVMGVSAANATLGISYTAISEGVANISVNLSGYTADKAVDYLQVTITGSADSFKYQAESLQNHLSENGYEINQDFDSNSGKLILFLEPNVAGDVSIPAGTTELVSFTANEGASARYTLTANYIVCYTDGTSSEGTTSSVIVAPRRGDVNGDGVVDLSDLLRYKRYMADSAIDFVFNNANLTGNGTYGADDLVILKKILLGVI